MEKMLETKLAEKLDIPKTEADRLVNAVKDVLIECIQEDKNFRLDGIGSFNTSLRKERFGRNPKTGETLIIPEAWVVNFKPYKRLKEAVNS
ncbi:HU family DNA-binding protein [Flavilitoribacter nigricans]|uniref:DNA-binding protein n=1 Tax=Flavilitoribacter nigricans (strain ATCC 23147 / DSM 23189 / NBRC 102662 / NCIMB 1420 / SS-2) TaxID=1122177 RepID=A0A2D0NED2_FLAN2|nr:HU family DNA-binding protein [Flavilitoribacter nigricans]PHN06837.1 DNA-binding protein [Flavilitoribacter nigricans DSM 23189 = NBRC 102662]